MWDLLHRPLRYADVLGQEANIQILKARIKNGSAAHTSYVFAGGYGRGKTTLARIHARAMLCLDLDKRDPEPCNQCDNCLAVLNGGPGAFSERDAASVNGVEAARSLVEELPYALANAAKRIYLFDEAQRMTAAAQDVLLKPLEEERMVGMFCTTELEKLRSAIRSRCETYIISRVATDVIVGRAQEILQKQGMKPADPEALRIVVDKADGHVRDVVLTLESLSQVGSITVESVREYLNIPVVSYFYEILLSLDVPSAALEWADKALERVSPVEACSGLADAALNSFYVGKRVPVDSSLVDRRLAAKVYDKLGDGVLALGQAFLRERYVSRSALCLRIGTLSQGLGIGESVPVVARRVESAPIELKATAKPAKLKNDHSPDPTPSGSDVEQRYRDTTKRARGRGDNRKSQR